MSSKDFFLDIFNNILDYNNNKVMIIFDSYGNIWFGLRDVMKMLGYVDIINIVNNMKINDDYRKKFIDYKGDVNC
jgi:prophage antirepressor-like protein